MCCYRMWLRWSTLLCEKDDFQHHRYTRSWHVPYYSRIKMPRLRTRYELLLQNRPVSNLSFIFKLTERVVSARPVGYLNKYVRLRDVRKYPRACNASNVVLTILKHTGWAKKCDTSRTLHYIVREVSLFWPTLYDKIWGQFAWASSLQILGIRPPCAPRFTPMITWLDSRWWLAACDWCQRYLQCCQPASDVAENFGRYLVGSNNKWRMV